MSDKRNVDFRITVSVSPHGETGGALTVSLSLDDIAREHGDGLLQKLMGDFLPHAHVLAKKHVD